MTDADEIKHLLKLMQQSMNEKFSSMQSQLTVLTDRVGVIEQRRESCDSDIQSSSNSSGGSSNNGITRKRRNPTELQVS